jgi:putative transcriptional regulator
MPKQDGKPLDAPTGEDGHAGATVGLCARPLALVSTIRRVLWLSQEEFAQRFHIPLAMVQEWEQGGREPDAVASAYLHVIAREPEAGCGRRWSRCPGRSSDGAPLP